MGMLQTNKAKLILLSMVILCLSFSVQAQKKIVASTSWVGAIVEASGIENITVLAPIELRHPPEYDYKPADIVNVLEADYVVWGGYEPFIKKLALAHPGLESKFVQVRTTNIPDNLISQTRMLASLFQTEEKQKRWEEVFLKEIEDFKNRAIIAKVQEKTVAVNVHQNEFLTWLGYKPFFVFGGEQLTPMDIATILQKNPDLIVDNYNSQDGKVMIDNAAYVILFNFPTKDFPTLLDVMRENIKRLGL